MKAIINKRTITIFSISVLLAIIAIVSVNVFNNAGPVTGAANIITRPVRALASTVARTFSRIFNAIYEYEELVARNEELSRRIAEMESDYRESAVLAQENAQLRALLEFRERHGGGYDYEMASFVNWGSDNWAHTFVINRGYTNSSIEPGMGVATEFGMLVGQVASVGATESTVNTVLDTKFSAAAFVGRRDTGEESTSAVVAKGDFAYMRSGMLILDQIDDDLLVRRGDTVITSGTGGVFPNGLIIGEVNDVFRHANSIGRFAVVNLLFDIDSITTVFVITGFERSE